MKLLSLSIVLALGVAIPFSFAADADSSTKPYPLTTCVVSTDELGSMGKILVFEYEGQEVKLCCKGCKKQFDKDPEKFMKMIQSAAK